MSEPHPFVSYLERLGQDRGALATLRRGLGQAPGTDLGAYRYVVPWLSEEAPPWQEAAYFSLAALYGLHPVSGGTGNLGDHYAAARAQGQGANDSALERRFTALLNAHPDDLSGALRQAISYLASKEVPIDWHQLLRDMLAWGHPSHYVQKNWARAYWGRADAPEPESEED